MDKSKVIDNIEDDEIKTGDSLVSTFSRSETYKNCFLILEEITDYNKQTIASILKTETYVFDGK
jgi:hypothetical protein